MGWTGPRNLAALLWALNNGVPTVVVVDSNEHDFLRTAWKEGVKRRLVSRYSVGWAASTSSARYLARLGMPTERIVKGPVDTIDVDHFRAGADAARQRANHVRRSLGLAQLLPVRQSVGSRKRTYSNWPKPMPCTAVAPGMRHGTLQ